MVLTWGQDRQCCKHDVKENPDMRVGWKLHAGVAATNSCIVLCNPLADRYVGLAYSPRALGAGGRKCLLARTTAG